MKVADIPIQAYELGIAFLRFVLRFSPRLIETWVYYHAATR